MAAFPSSAFAVALPSTGDMPETITVRNQEVALKNLKNPLRQDQGNLTKYIREGGEIYFKNCFLCHGDLLDGKGIFGESFFPPPADFTHSASVTTLPESYAYWRIMKGGQGLPDKYSPWDSAMPAWETQLEEEEVWKVILFIFSRASEKYRTTASPSDPSPEHGEQLYREHCSYCHGDDGKGKGPAAKFSSPRPRNFTKGQYKIRSTPFGKIPADQDMFDMITRGMPGTTMPGWGHLPVSDRLSLVLYIKSLTTKFEKFHARGKPLEQISVPQPPPFTLESLESGRELFLQNCSGCHGVMGRSDGPSTHKIVDIASDAIWPRNLSKPWAFRRGYSREQLFMTLRTGLSATAMPRFSPRVFRDEQIWNIVHYVQTLSPPEKPAVNQTLNVREISGELPLNPSDPVWKIIEPNFYPLGGQIIASEKLYAPTVNSVTVKAIHNGDEIAIYMHWDDPAYDPALNDRIAVEESPAPPLPPEFQTEEPEKEEQKSAPAQQYPDAIALQFPVTLNLDGKKPYFLNGDAQNPVNLWKWQSNPLQTQEMNAIGLNHWTTQQKENQQVLSQAVYQFGRYYLVMKRKLVTEDPKNDIQFQRGRATPIAFNVWDGSQGETGSKKAISSWFEMILK